MIDDTLLLEIADNQKWEFPFTLPLVLDSKLIEAGKIQLYLKVTQFVNQDGLCLCQEPLGNDVELHHALITRKDVMGMANPEIIHSNFNVLLLHHKCHEKVRRSLCLIYLSEIFGFKNIQTYYQHVKFQMKTGGFRNVESIVQNIVLSE